MTRFGFKLTICPGTEEEYKDRHKAVYADLLAAFANNGVTTYSIFMDGTTLFAYMEATEVHKALAGINENPANTRWQAYMSDILVADENGDTIQPLEEVFFFKP